MFISILLFVMSVSSFGFIYLQFTPITLPSYYQRRDVENDETQFCLIIPATYKNCKDPNAEVFSLKRVGHQLTYKSLRDIDATSKPQGTLDSILEDEEADGGGGIDAMRSGRKKYANNADDNSSVSSTGSKKSSMFRRTPCQDKEQAIIYQFRVLLDGNEKVGLLCCLTVFICLV